jgi:hypothetical protein
MTGNDVLTPLGQIYRCRYRRRRPSVDLTADRAMVLVRLAERMRTIAYDPSKSFRGWLRTLT